jgi:hypothetical protein
MNKLINLLQQLSELDPATCRPMEGNGYEIGIYRFFLDTNGELHGYAFGSMHNSCTGRPALAWLRGAVEAACEARGWYWELRYWPPRKKHWAEIANLTQWADTPAEALLAAFVEAVRATKVSEL